MEQETRKSLPVFVMHDDPYESAWAEERIWLIVAAENAHQAKAIAAGAYEGDTPKDWNWEAAFLVYTPRDTSKWPERIRPYWPQVLTDLESQRLCEFFEDGERCCDSCGLYPMGMKDHEVCDGCSQCVECGCCCEEDNNE